MEVAEAHVAHPQAVHRADCIAAMVARYVAEVTQWETATRHSNKTTANAFSALVGAPTLMAWGVWGWQTQAKVLLRNGGGTTRVQAPEAGH